jgi:hypothetical protein
MLPSPFFAKIITKYLHISLWGKRTFLGYFCNLKELAKVNNHPLGEKWPILVTLLGFRME